MSLFETDNGTPAEQKAKQLLGRVNAEFSRTHAEHVRSVREFWRHDMEATPTGPTGVEVLIAMGTSAQAFLAVAYARVVMLVTIQQILGRDDLVDVASMQAPYAFEFNKDGSLATASFR